MYISFVDDTTRYVTISFLKSKDEAATKVKQYLTLIERQDQKLPKVVHADNGCEYVNKDLIGWCLDKGIELQMTAPHTLEQNGIAEK
jgi:transposase InsO family protein